jgi:hypothetical protein
VDGRFPDVTVIGRCAGDGYKPRMTGEDGLVDRRIPGEYPAQARERAPHRYSALNIRDHRAAPEHDRGPPGRTTLRCN